MVLFWFILFGGLELSVFVIDFGLPLMCVLFVWLMLVVFALFCVFLLMFAFPCLGLELFDVAVLGVYLLFC